MMLVRGKMVVLDAEIRLYHTAVHCIQGKYTEAELLHERLQALREKVLGPEHPDVAASLNNRAFLLMGKVRTVRFFQDLS